MKKFKANRISAIVSVMLVFSLLFSGNVWAKEKEIPSALRKLNSTGISQYATDNQVNIVIYDSQNNISSEYHSDGLQVKYSVDPSTHKVKEITNSEGVRTIIEEKPREKLLKTYDVMGNITDQKTIKLDNDNENINISIKNIKMATEKTLRIPKDTVALRASTDYIKEGYNLSNMVPSIGTVVGATDKFGRPPTAMSQTAIQNYLVSKNSVLRNSIRVWAYNSSGTLYDTGRSISPSAVINQASLDYWINPKILLGKLQGESSLVYKTSGVVSTRAFAFCMGYNATDGGDIYNGTGFDSQISNAARVLISHWNEAYNMQSSLPYYFDNLDTDIYVSNCGTYALYKYTPWVSSNLLLAKVFKMMFPGTEQNGVNWN